MPKWLVGWFHSAACQHPVTATQCWNPNILYATLWLQLQMHCMLYTILYFKRNTPAADGGAASVMAVQANMGVTVLITKMLSLHVFSFPRSYFSPATSLHFSFPCFSPLCKLHLQHKQSLATSSHFSISMSITLMFLLQMSLKWRRDCLCALLPVASSLYRMTFKIFRSSIQCICLSQHCWRRVYKLDNLTQVRTTALVTQLLGSR